MQSLNPSTNFKDKVEITCNLNTFHNAGTDANKGQKEYTLNLYRCTPSTSWSSKPIATYTINDSTTTTVVFTDKDVNPCETYKYKVEVTALEKTFSLISSTTGSISGSTEVTSVVASRGTFSGTVRLTWNVTQVGTSLTYFNVQRRLLGSQDENDFLTIYTTSGVATSYSYEDNTAQPGTYYEAALLQKLLESPAPLEDLSDSRFAEILDCANAVGSLTTTRRGAIAAIPSKEEIDACMASTPRI